MLSKSRALFLIGVVTVVILIGTKLGNMVTEVSTDLANRNHVAIRGGN